MLFVPRGHSHCLIYHTPRARNLRIPLSDLSQVPCCKGTNENNRGFSKTKISSVLSLKFISILNNYTSNTCFYFNEYYILLIKQLLNIWPMHLLTAHGIQSLESRTLQDENPSTPILASSNASWALMLPFSLNPSRPSKI